MAGTTGLEPATSAVTGQRSNQLSYVPRLFFNNLGYMPHRFKCFEAFALFARFYRFAVVDPIFWLSQTPNPTKNCHATTGLSLSDVTALLLSRIDWIGRQVNLPEQGSALTPGTSPKALAPPSRLQGDPNIPPDLVLIELLNNIPHFADHPARLYTLFR